MAATTQFLLDNINSSFEFVFRIESVFLFRNPHLVSSLYLSLPQFSCSFRWFSVFI